MTNRVCTVAGALKAVILAGGKGDLPTHAPPMALRSLSDRKIIDYVVAQRISTSLSAIGLPKC